jgi:hypothetical protein
LPDKVLCCGILKQEIECLVKDKNIEMHYFDPALHVDFDKLEESLTCTLNNMAAGNTVLVFGTKCHPDMENIAAKHGARIIRAGNCIEMLLGDGMAQLDAEARTFYFTGGWLANWRKIFIEGLKWDKVDARQNFGYHERILLLDTGFFPIDDEELLEFFEYTGVPIEVKSINLENLGKKLKELFNSEE